MALPHPRAASGRAVRGEGRPLLITTNQRIQDQTSTMTPLPEMCRQLQEARSTFEESLDFVAGFAEESARLLVGREREGDEFVAGNVEIAACLVAVAGER